MKWISLIYYLLLVALLAACAGAADLSMVMQATATPAKPNSTLNIFSQDDALDRTTLDNFESQFGVKVNYANFTTNASGLADIRTSLASYDLVVLSDTLVGLLRPNGLFTPLDHENIPNFKNLDPAFVNALYDPGNRYCAPFQWGTMGLGYNKQVVRGNPPGWADFFEAKTPRRLGLPDDSRLSLAAALLYLGYSPNTTNILELAEARRILEERAGQIVVYAPAAGSTLLARGQVDFLFARSGAILTLRDRDPNFEYTIPAEGSVMWVDNLCLLRGSNEPELAETFINYILEAPVSAALAQANQNSLPNAAALTLLKETKQPDPILYPDPDTRQRLFSLVNIDPAATQNYNQFWAGLTTSFEQAESN
ncbi:MAG: spermidine/putrescine ABC transporter substrate-binding protein [Anaerolineales bacterium]|nr:spermidine/putrescine ABC transporter substrate-binding protein [Anaerolineales bacterium]